MYCQIPCYPIISLVELLIPIGPLFQLKSTFLTLSMPIRGLQRSINIFVQSSNMFCLFKEIYWSLDEVILGKYWRFLYSGFKVVTKIYYLSNMFHLNRSENRNCNSSSEKHLRNPKTSKGSQLDLELLIFVKKFEFYLVAHSL